MSKDFKELLKTNHIRQNMDFKSNPYDNALSGEFSILATGFIVRNEKTQKPFDGIIIVGNIYGLPTIFRLGALANNGSFGFPSIIVKDISVLGIK